MSESLAETAPQAAKGNGCWRTIGVWGNVTPRCELLEEALHCFNCEHYQAASREVLEREASEEEIRAAAELLARPRESREKGREAVLVFRVGSERFALPLGACEKILPESPACRVPNRDPWILRGMVNVGGRLAPCVSLAGLLGIGEGPEEAAPKRSMIVARIADHRVVFPVAEILGTVLIDEGRKHPPPASAAQDSRSLSAFVLTTAEAPVSCLDPGRLRRILERKLG